MEHRLLGGSGLKVPVLSFGTATFGGSNEFFGAWGNSDVAAATRLVAICLEAGANLFDTADVYSDGRAEEILGQAIAGRRDQVLISTKANIGSVFTDIAPPASAVYTATKGAVDAITAVLAKELGPKNIRVNALNPGLTITEGTHTGGIAGSDFETNAVKNTPLGRTGRPDDIAKAAVFLASDDSGWVTGDKLRVGGGIY